MGSNQLLHPYFLPLRLSLLLPFIVSLSLLAIHRPALLRRCRLASRPF